MTWPWITLTALCILTALLWKLTPASPFSAIHTTAEPATALDLSPVSATQCGPCHSEHFKQWSGSVHASSLTSANFSKAFSDYLNFVGDRAREDPQASMACFSCHAPLLKNADPQTIRRVAAFVLAKETASLDGFEVGCVACHAAGGGVYSGPIGDPKENPFHPSKFARSYNESSSCAACHTWTRPAVPCSDVHTDWKKSQAAKQGRTCQSCHMAEQEGTAASGGPLRRIHDHAFPGGRSTATLQQAVSLRLKAAFRKNRLEVAATVRNFVPHRVPDGCPWNSTAVLEVSVSDETGWEFETQKRVYANFGIDKNGKATALAWTIVKRSPRSTALKAEETRVEKLSFAVEPRDGNQFTIQARMRYHYTPPSPVGFGQDSETIKMTETKLTLPGKRPSWTK